MKVLFISNDPTIFETESPAHARMREYAAALGDLHVVSHAPSGAAAYEAGGLYLHAVTGSKLFSFSRLEKLAAKIVREHGIDVVSAQDPFEYGRIAARAIEGTQAKLQIQIHTDFLSPWFVKGGGFRSPQVKMPAINTVRRAIADSVLPKASGIRVVSERIRASLIERYGTKIPDPVVIPIAVPAQLPPAVALPAHPFSFVLMTVGRLEPEKRIIDILYALGRLQHQYRSVGLMVVGDGTRKRALMQIAKKLGLQDRVMFLGWRTDMLALLQSAHAYIQASAYEGYGRTLVEAALARLPIITTDVGIVGEVFQGYKDVLAAPVADPAALAVHIAGLVQDHQARELLSREAEHTVRNHIAAIGDVPTRFAQHLSSL